MEDSNVDPMGVISRAILLGINISKWGHYNHCMSIIKVFLKRKMYKNFSDMLIISFLAIWQNYIIMY